MQETSSKLIGVSYDGKKFGHSTEPIEFKNWIIISKKYRQSMFNIACFCCYRFLHNNAIKTIESQAFSGDLELL